MEEIIALVNIIIILTIPAYIIIIKNKKPISTGKFIPFKINAKAIKETDTPKIYQ